MTTATSKLPTNSRPIINDPDLANAVEALLGPYSGKALERAQVAVRKVAASGVQGPWSMIVSAYETEIKRAVGKDAADV
jgi:hypothetical protein